MTVAIVGLGLIGGSVGLALRHHGWATRLLGVDANHAHAAEALAHGLVDELTTLEGGLADADCILLAIPVDVISQLLPLILDKIGSHQVVVDLGSTKQAIAQAVATHPARARYVAAHPMAGTERSGPGAALADLFHNRVAILCDIEQSAPDARLCAENLFRDGLGMRLINMDAARHDLHAAYISHLSHVISYALSLTALEKERDGATLLSLAGGGFSSTVRLAKSDASMWTPIFRQNREFLLQAVAAYRHQLDLLTAAIADDSPAAIDTLITQANAIRDILP